MPATYEPIATTTLGSNASSITFGSIAASWTDLRLVLTASSSTNGVPIAITFNGDSGSNYSYTRIWGDGGSAASDRVSSQTAISAMSLSGGTGFVALHTLDVFSYSSSLNKTALLSTDNDTNGGGRVRRGVALWRNTAAITSIGISVSPATFEVGTTATLYGILKA